MRCPICGDEFQSGVVRCSGCDADLVDADGLMLRAPAGVSIGRFHPSLVPVVREHLDRRGANTRAALHDDGVEIRVDAEVAEQARADLVVNWERLLAGLDVEQRAEVAAAGGRLPGWPDAPDSLWVDRRGRLLADADEIGERALGPALVAIGGIMLLIAWYAGAGSFRLLMAVTGLIVVLVGFFLPR